MFVKMDELHSKMAIDKSSKEVFSQSNLLRDGGKLNFLQTIFNKFL